MFGSILPISLQQIEYEKNYAVHSHELAKSYTMKPMTIYIDKYLGGDIVKLIVFSLLAYNTTYENVTKIAHFSQYFAHISSKNRTCKKIRSAIQRACRGLHFDTSYYFQGGRVGGIRLGRS